MHFSTAFGGFVVLAPGKQTHPPHDTIEYVEHRATRYMTCGSQHAAILSHRHSEVNNGLALLFIRTFTDGLQSGDDGISPALSSANLTRIGPMISKKMHVAVMVASTEEPILTACGALYLASSSVNS